MDMVSFEAPSGNIRRLVKGFSMTTFKTLIVCSQFLTKILFLHDYDFLQ